MTDRIFINGLALHAFHGIMAHEAKVGQSFTIDFELEIDLSAAARSDKVVDTVSMTKWSNVRVRCSARSAFG